MKTKTINNQNSDEMNKMNTLFNKASCSSSNREKNQLLTQLRTLSLEFFFKFEKIITRNSIREKELASLQKNFDEVQKKLNLTEMHIDQKMELEKRGIKSDKHKIISNIKKTEEELKSFAPLERPNLLQNAIDREEKDDPHLKPILLWDIEMQRYEELIYILQKRVIAIEENHQCADKILEEFGSVFGLIDKYKSLTVENKKLKQEETYFLNDPVVKRRNNSNISIFAVRKLILTLQKELQSQNLLLSSLDKENYESRCSLKHTNSFIKKCSEKKADPINKAIAVKQDFDSLCNDPNFTMYLSSNSTSSENPDHNDDIILTPEEAIEEQKKNIIQIEEQLKKLESDVNSMRKQVIKVDSSAGSKCLKLFDLNQRLFGQIQSMHEKIDASNEDAIILLDKLKKMMLIKNFYEFQISSFFDPYRSLLSDFYDVSGRLTNNIHVDKSLSSISSIFAKDIINENTKEQILFSYLNPQLYEVEKKLRDIAEKEKEKEREKEREREAKKSSRNKNQKIDIQTFMSGVQKSSRSHTSTPSSHPRGRPSISSLSVKTSNTNSTANSSATASPTKDGSSFATTNNNTNGNENPSQNPNSPAMTPTNNNNNINSTSIPNENTNKHSIKFLPLQIPQTEHTRHHHQRRPSQMVLQQKQQQQQQIILKMKQNKLLPIFATSLLTRLAEISGFIFKKENLSHTQFLSTWKAVKSNLTDIIKGKMDEFEVTQHQLISQVQFCGNNILVKELKDIETMTLPIIKLDIETQYEDQKKKPKPKK